MEKQRLTARAPFGMTNSKFFRDLFNGAKQRRGRAAVEEFRCKLAASPASRFSKAQQASIILNEPKLS